jgi:coenzyme PQQ precursor peptide PqqA
MRATGTAAKHAKTEHLRQCCCSIPAHLRFQRHGTDLATQKGERPPDLRHQTYIKETVMQWSNPEFIDFRFGFEITLYIFNR